MKFCVFCGASPGNSPAYQQAATELGHAMADAGIGLVYGGSSVGLMGIVANAALARGGEVIGVIPRFLADKELAHKKLTRLHVVGSMHQRKAMMAGLANGFIALPGGIGTLEELFEIWTWAQLGQHQKPCALLNINGFYDRLTGFLDHVTTEGFIKPQYRNTLIVKSQAGTLLSAMHDYRPPEQSRWMSGVNL
ncbi:MAG: TIGR00730 family Rossman fold protein [Lautropia sp.]|nr:TIGR00730 family Rossman fold protein [Lautropia sp.]